jgi:hypothetical protein
LPRNSLNASYRCGTGVSCIGKRPTAMVCNGAQNLFNALFSDVLASE